MMMVMVMVSRWFDGLTGGLLLLGVSVTATAGSRGFWHGLWAEKRRRLIMNESKYSVLRTVNQNESLLRGFRGEMIGYMV